MMSIEETNARLEEEFAQQNAQGQDLLLKQGESKALDESMRASSVPADKAEEIAPDVSAFGSDQRPLRQPPGILFPDDSHETDQNVKNFLTRITRDSEKRKENPPLLLNDLRELGIYG